MSHKQNEPAKFECPSITLLPRSETPFKWKSDENIEASRYEAPNATSQAAFAALVWFNSLADHIGYSQSLCLAQPDPLKGFGDLGLLWLHKSRIT